MKLRVDISSTDDNYNTLASTYFIIDIDEISGSAASGVVAAMVDYVVQRSKQAVSPDAQPDKPQNETTKNEDIPY